MIPEFVKRFEEKKEELRAKFSASHPEGYSDIVKSVVELLSNEEDYPTLDPERIHNIDDGDYQGTHVFVIAATGYQPWDYWYYRCSYGSCSGCDTFQAIREYGDDAPTKEQVKDYMGLALNVVQGLKKDEGGQLMQGRGKKTSYDKNARANEEFQKGKRFGRPKQRWVPIAGGRPGQTEGYWEKVK